MKWPRNGASDVAYMVKLKMTCIAAILGAPDDVEVPILAFGDRIR